MAELLITSSLDPIEEKQVFSDSMPRRRVTLAYFDLPDIHMNEFVMGVGKTIEAFSPLEIEGNDAAQFGPNNDIKVRRVKSLGKHGLTALHTNLALVIEDHHGVFKNPGWVYEGYSPHVTYVNGVALDEGERVALNTVELIENNPVAGTKFVRKIWELEEA